MGTPNGLDPFVLESLGEIEDLVEQDARGRIDNGIKILDELFGCFMSRKLENIEIGIEFFGELTEDPICQDEGDSLNSAKGSEVVEVMEFSSIDQSGCMHADMLPILSIRCN